MKNGKLLNSILAAAAIGAGSAFGGNAKPANDNVTPFVQVGDKIKENLTFKERFLARVIYSETSSIASFDEFKLVCKVIMNRVNNKEFGDKKIGTPNDAYEVVKVKNAFSCINDKGNENWWAFKPDLNGYTSRACMFAKLLMKGNQDYLPNYPDIVYYHDKSIECPEKWTNKYWKPVLVKSTKNFKFYKIVPNNKK